MGLFSFVLALVKQLLDVVCGFWYEIGQSLDVTRVWQTYPNCFANAPITLTLEQCIPVGLIYQSLLCFYCESRYSVRTGPQSQYELTQRSVA